MPFQPGNKLYQLRKKSAIGRPTVEQTLAKQSLRQEIERMREAAAAKIAATYIKMATNDPSTMRHLIDKVMPAAPTRIDLGVLVNRQSVLAILANKEGKEAALAVTKLLADRQNAQVIEPEIPE